MFLTIKFSIFMLFKHSLERNRIGDNGGVALGEALKVRVMSKVATDCLTVYNEIQYYIGNIHGLMISCSMGGSIGHPRIIHDKDCGVFYMYS